MNETSLDAPNASRVRRILEAIRRMWQPGEVHELRILGSGRGVLSGYYDDAEAFARDAALWNGRANIYWTINPINPDLLIRSKNSLKEFVGEGLTTSDAGIIRRCWLPVDVDSVRPSGVAATHTEHCRALAMVGRIADYLTAAGFPQPAELDSGNGGHLLYPVDLPNDGGGRTFVKRFLETLAREFDNDAARVDVSCFNASRIMRVSATLNVKGSNTPERPHRYCILTAWPLEVL
jgi:hypothetical protein